MKHHITLKQWDEITGEQKNILWDDGFKRDWKMNIIQMMEFLGDDFEELSREFDPHLFSDKPMEKKERWGIGMKNRNNMWYFEKELCDTLWKAVKYKLNNATKSNNRNF